jgi:hypothetical protein
MGGKISFKTNSATSSCHTDEFTWFGGVLQQSLGCKHGHNGQRTDEFIDVAVMFMVVIHFL